MALRIVADPERIPVRDQNVLEFGSSTLPPPPQPVLVLHPSDSTETSRRARTRRRVDDGIVNTIYDLRIVAASGWAEYRRQVFGDPQVVSHDGADFTRYRSRWATEPVRAARMLRLGLAGGDSVAADTVGELSDLLTEEQKEQFTALLIVLLQTHRGTFGVSAARSLFALTGDASHAAPAVEALRSESAWTRLHAAEALRCFPANAELVAEVRRAAAADEDSLVRFLAANTLRRWAGEATDLSSERDLFEQFTVDASPAERARVAAILASRIALTQS